MPIPVPKTLTLEQIAEFKAIFKQAYDFELTDEEAIVEGLNLIELIVFILDDETEAS